MVLKKGISIVIPTYNRPKLTAEAVNSALRFLSSINVPSEIIVGENPSLNCYEPSGSIVYHKWETNTGPLGNWIQSLSLAQFSACLLLFSDDIINYSECITDVLEKIWSNQIPYAINNCSIYDGTRVVCSDLYKTPPYITYEKFALNCLFSSKGYPESPTSSLFNTEYLFQSLKSYSFPFGHDNGAGPDLLCFICFLQSDLKHFKNTSVEMSGLSVSFRTHAESFSSSDKTSLEVFINYCRLRMILARSLSLNKFPFNSIIGYRIGNRSYRQAYLIAKTLLGESYMSPKYMPVFILAVCMGSLASFLRILLAKISSLYKAA